MTAISMIVSDDIWRYIISVGDDIRRKVPIDKSNTASFKLLRPIVKKGEALPRFINLKPKFKRPGLCPI